MILPSSSQEPQCGTTSGSFTVTIDVSTFHCSVPGPRCQASKPWGTHLWPPFSWSPTVPCHLNCEGSRSMFPLLGLSRGGDFDVSPCRKRGKDRLPLRWWLKQLWDHAKPQRHGLVLPLCSLELKVDFSSFPLPPASPPIPQLLAVPVCMHGDNTQNCLLLPWQWNKASRLAFERCPSLLTPGRIPGDLWSAANQSPSHSHFPWHSWNSPTACPLSFSYSARLKLFAPLPPCLSLPFLRPTSLPPAGQAPMALDGRATNVSLLSLLTRNPPPVLLQPTGPFQAPSSWAMINFNAKGVERESSHSGPTTLV